jgi:hypothetical protein
MLRTIQLGAVAAAGAAVLLGWGLATGRVPSSRSSLAGPSLFPVISAAAEPATRPLRRGGTFTLTGRHAPHAGSIAILGRWGSGPWRTMAAANGLRSTYSVRIPLTRSGVLELQIRYPDGSTAFRTVRVR